MRESVELKGLARVARRVGRSPGPRGEPRPAVRDGGRGLRAGEGARHGNVEKWLRRFP